MPPELFRHEKATGANVQPPAVVENQAMPTSFVCAHATFAVPELLGQIIVKLPAQAILTAAIRVSHRWRDAITGSPDVRQKLCLMPKSAIIASPFDIDRSDWHLGGRPTYNEALQVNPILEALLPPAAPWDIQDLPRKALWGRLYECILEACGEWSQSYRFLRCSIHRVEDISKCWHPEGSWRRMFLTQPPCSVVHVQLLGKEPFSFHKEAVTAVNRFCISHPEGITLGLVDDLVHAAIGNMLGTTSWENFEIEASVQVCLIARKHNVVEWLAFNPVDKSFATGRTDPETWVGDLAPTPNEGTVKPHFREITQGDVVG